MILNKALLIKGLAGLTTIAATATPLALNWNKIFKKTASPNEGNEINQPTTVDATSLITAVGLSCGTPSSSGTDCSMSSTPGATVNLNVKKEENKSDGITAISSSTGGTGGKIRLYSGDTTNAYKSGLKFVIEGGDVTLTGGSGSQTISKLEEFETYQIEEEVTGDTKKYYLSRKEKAADEIRRTLGLPESCGFPTDSSSNTTCTANSNDINGIDFLGKSGNVTNSSSSSLTLTITKVSDASSYPLGYKFSFKTTGSNNITVSTTDTNTPITFRPNGTVDFKIKKEGNNDKDLKLEKDLTLNTLLNEVGLSGCTATDGSNECTIGTTGLNVKQGNGSGEEGRTKDTSSSSGKIKVYSDTSYENKFKFVIEDGDINFGSSGGSITKLEEFETYEIKKETAENKWYFSRKSDALEEKFEALGLPSGDTNCKLPSSNSETKTCTLDLDKLKKINFEGKDSSGTPTIDDSGTAKLKISKTDDTTTYPNGGYKFVFETTQSNITIPKEGSGNIYIKKNTNTEFKIKKDGKNLTLEKVWTVTKLGEKAGLNCPDPTSDKKCTFNENKINVNNGEDNSKISDAKLKNDSADKKMSYQEDQEGYNQGFKFFLDETEDLSLTCNGSDDSESNKKIEKKSNSSGSETSYEIKEDSNDKKWYLTKHTAVSK